MGDPAQKMQEQVGGEPALESVREPFDVDEYEFGGKVGQSIGASLSGDRDEQCLGSVRREQDERRKKAARNDDWQSDLAQLSHEERVQKTMECLERRQSYMNTLRGLLAYCAEERTYDDITAYVEAFPEFTANRTSAHRYVFFLKRTGALAEIELNAEGIPLTDEMRDEARGRGLSEEEIEDMAVEWHVITTDVGQEALKRSDPVERLGQLLSVKASRVPTYCRVLEFCKTPRSLAEVTSFLEGDPGLEIDEKTGAPRMQPSAYISKLDQAGVLIWQGAWKTTEEGERALRDMQMTSADDKRKSQEGEEK